jgi:hypothetical protein
MSTTNNKNTKYSSKTAFNSIIKKMNNVGNKTTITSMVTGFLNLVKLKHI